MEWLEPSQALVLLLVGAGATYLSQRRIEAIKAQKEALAAERVRLDAAESRLRDERLRIYVTILDPYIEVLHALGRGLPAVEANHRLSSTDHRKAAFQLKIIGTDDVVRAFNTFTRYIVDAQHTGQDRPGEILRRWATFVLAIRRNIGEPNSTLSEQDMVLDWIADIETVYPELGPPPVRVPGGALSAAAGEAGGVHTRVGGREISMQRLEELRILAGRFRDGIATDVEIIEIFGRIPDAPGAEVLLEPDAYFSEAGRALDVPRPREFLDAIQRHNQPDPSPRDSQLLEELVRFMKGIHGRQINVVDPRTGRSFQICA